MVGSGATVVTVVTVCESGRILKTGLSPGVSTHTLWQSQMYGSI